MKLLKYCFLGILSVILVPACRTTSDYSTVKHDLGRTLNDDSPYQWHETTDEEYFRIVGHHIGITKDEYDFSKDDAVAADNPATQRLQFWVDAVDSMLRARDPRKLEGVPKPVVHLIRSKVVNAFVAPIKVCLKLGVVVSGQESQKEGGTLLFSRTKGTFQPDTISESQCVHSSMTIDQEIAAAAWQFSAYPQCKFEMKDGVIHISKDCIGNIDIGRFKTLAITQTSNQITVFTQFMPLVTEDQMIETLAHELGHYYMSLHTTPEATYGMFYRLGAQNLNEKPKSDPAAEALGKKLINGFNTWIDFSKLSPIEGQHFHSGLYKPIRMLAYKLQEIECPSYSTDCQSPCGKFFKSLGEPLLQKFPAEALSPSGTLAYKEFEQRAELCLSNIKLSEQAGVAGTISYDEVLTSIKEYGANIASILQPLPRQDNLAALFQVLTLKIQAVQKSQESDFTKLYMEAYDFNLAQYTYEQEADELSLEWIDQLGINPAVGVDGTISVLKAIQALQNMYPGEVDAAQCEKLAQNDWRDRNGKHVMVPIASWTDPHHSGCYRAFNMAREIAVHKLQTYKTKSRPQPPGPKWEELVKMIMVSESTIPSSNASPRP